MHFDLCTLFPEMFDGFLTSGIIRRAHEKNVISTKLLNFREFATDVHRTVDDTPYGGGGGMLLKPEPLFAAVEHLLGSKTQQETPVILTTPQGKPFNQRKAEELAEHKHIIIVCGRYEGYDERIRRHLATDEISVGDYVLTGGELPAMIIIDAVTRLLSDALGNSTSATNDSFSLNGLLEYPQYTKPRSFRGLDVPEVLLSGDHAAIETWRHAMSLKRTWEQRPELLNSAKLNDADKIVIKNLEYKKAGE